MDIMKNNKGFILLESIVVIVILTIIGLAILTAFTGSEQETEVFVNEEELEEKILCPQGVKSVNYDFDHRIKDIECK